MVNVKQNVAGAFRTAAGAAMFCQIRGDSFDGAQAWTAGSRRVAIGFGRGTVYPGYVLNPTCGSRLSSYESPMLHSRLHPLEDLFGLRLFEEIQHSACRDDKVIRLLAKLLIGCRTHPTVHV